MSSIMDELKTLQSKRTGTGTPGGPLTGDGDPPAGGGPVLRSPGRGRRSPPALVLGVVIALGAVIAALVLPGLGRKSPPADSTTIARANDQPRESVADAGDSVPSTPPEAIGDDAPPPEAGGDQPVASAETDAGEAAEADATKPTPAEPADADGTVASAAAGEVDESPDGPADEDLQPDAGTEVAEATDEAGPEPPKEAAPPVRVLTKAEDEANKAAIRGLKVFGVLVDDKGGGVYTSAGELRVGSRFNDMEVLEVTARHVIFKSCNKRYRWMLPR